jgi:hypothetical protein
MLSRWLTYQQERFPIVKHGLLIAVFSFAAIGYSSVMRGGEAERSVLQFLGLGFVACISAALFFLQLQIVDDLKDFKEDTLYRPHYPVPRGVVALQELKVALVASGLVQLGLAMSLGFPLVVMLGVIWGYMALLRKEIFVFKELNDKPLINLFLNALPVLLVAFYISMFDWVPAGSGVVQVASFLLVSFWVGVLIQLGQKICVPMNEKPGMKTYSASWGIQKAIFVWLSVIWLLAISALIAAAQIQFVLPIALTLLFLLTGSMIVSWRFLSRPVLKWENGLKLLSELWIFLVYFNLGIVPLLFRFNF